MKQRGTSPKKQASTQHQHLRAPLSLHWTSWQILELEKRQRLGYRSFSSFGARPLST